MLTDPRPGAPPYPQPRDLGRSPRENDVVALPGLVDLKLVVGRHQDLADVVALSRPLDETGYLELEALSAQRRSRARIQA